MLNKYSWLVWLSQCCAAITRWESSKKIFIVSNKLITDNSILTILLVYLVATRASGSSSELSGASDCSLQTEDAVVNLQLYLEFTLTKLVSISNYGYIPGSRSSGLSSDSSSESGTLTAEVKKLLSLFLPALL